MKDVRSIKAGELLKRITPIGPTGNFDCNDISCDDCIFDKGNARCGGLSTLVNWKGIKKMEFESPDVDVSIDMLEEHLKTPVDEYNQELKNA